MQAEDRAHRIGLQDSVLCQYFVLPGSFDEVMLTRVWDKQDKNRKGNAMSDLHDGGFDMPLTMKTQMSTAAFGYRIN